MKGLLHLLIPTAVIFLMAACRPNVPTYRIGFSQCSDGVWREVMLREMNNELLLHPDLALHYRCAYDHAELQCAQIDSFISERVDILVVAPLETNMLRPALQRAYDAHIPVIIFDRPMPDNQWTAYIGGDNRQVGLTLVQWLRQQQKKQGGELRVVEITGSLTTAPAKWRHEGLMEGLRHEENIRLIASLDGQWEKDCAERLADSILSADTEVDAFVTHSDWMAFGVNNALACHCRTIPVIGVDALPGEGNGVEAVLQGRLAATTTYPTRGDLVIQLASQILHGERFERQTHLQTILVQTDEARSIAAMAEAYQAQIAALRTLQEQVSLISHQHDMQRVVIILLIVLVVLLIGIVIGVWRWQLYHRRMLEAQAEKEKLILTQQMRLTQMTEQIESLEGKAAESSGKEEGAFLRQLTNQIEMLMSDQDLNVETLARAMNMSRAGLYRRVKNDIGQSPVELINRIRLERAKRLLEAGDKTIQQVAYEMGFSTPSYFTRCYKEYFGESPAR